MSIKQKTYDILKGKFLVEKDALKNWVFILFLTGLALMMISSSHSVDKKVQKIANLTALNRELRAQHIATRSNLMKLKMETSVIKKMKGTGLFVADVPPTKIKIYKKIVKK